MSYELQKISEEIERLYESIDSCEESIKDILNSETQLSRLFQHVQESSTKFEKDILLKEPDDRRRVSLLVTFVNDLIGLVGDSLKRVRYDKKYYVGVIDTSNDTISSLQKISLEINNKKVEDSESE